MDINRVYFYRYRSMPSTTKKSVPSPTAKVPDYINTI